MTIKNKIILTFDNGQQGLYEILSGELSPNAGNPGAAVKHVSGGGASIKIPLPSPSKVTYVEGDARAKGAWFSARIVQDDINSTYGNAFNRSMEPTGHQWITCSSGAEADEDCLASPGALNPTNIKEVQFHVGGAGQEGFLDNLVVEYEPGDLSATYNPSDAVCELGVHSESDNSINNPIGVRTGEKRVRVTDLVINTPVRPLTLDRAYSQNKQDEFDFMGLGWTHNHAIALTPPQNNEIILRLPNGGEGHFIETDPVGDPDHYDGVAGVTSVIDWDSGSSQYTLTTPDTSAFVFDSAGNLLSRTWPSGEVWTYSYYVGGADDGKLEKVADGYGRELIFTYHSSGAHTGLLYRVTDHDGRYVQYDYTPAKIVDSTGTIVDGTSAGTPVPANSLLTTVTDVMGEAWTYDYYDETDQHADVRQLNFLIARHSPAVTGAGSEIAIEEDSYTVQGTELAINGDMELNSDWTAVGSPTQGQSTNQVDTGTYAWYVNGASGEGIQGTTWNLVEGRTYIITARVYPVSGTAKMGVSSETAFDRASAGTGAWETLRAVYVPSADANNRRVQFLADGGAAEFYIDNVSIIESDLTIEAIQQQQGDAALTRNYAFQPNGDNITTEVIAGLTTTHHFQGEVYAGVELPGMNDDFGFQIQDAQYRPVVQVDANDNQTLLTWDASGRSLGSVVDALGNETTFTYDTSARLTESQDAEGRKTTYTYGDSNNPRLPTEIKVYDTDGTTLLRFQKYTYDTKGRTLTEQVINPADSVTVLQEVSRAYYTSGDGAGLLHTVTQKDIGSSNDVITTYTYDSAGRVIQTQHTSNFGSCEIQRTVYDAAGNVTMGICNYEVQGTSDPADWLWNETNSRWEDGAGNAIDHGSTLDQNTITGTTYDALGRPVQVRNVLGQVSLTVYDALDRVARTIANYDPQGSSAPGDWGWSIANNLWEDGSGNPIDHGTDQTKNIISDTDYNDRGMVRLQRDVLGQVTLLGYNDAGRLVKTIRNASTATYNNNYSGTSPDPDLSVYTPVNNPDQDVITEQVYDPNGNLVQAIDPLGQVAYTVYDALNRPVRTIANYVAQGNPVTNPADWVWANNQWEDGASNAIDHGTANDQNLIRETVYDALGRVTFTRDVTGIIARNAYDALGRQTHQIANYVAQGNPVTDPADWVWSATNSRWEDGATNAIDHGAENDQNLVTMTVYNAEGRVAQTIDVLGHQTHYSYDGLGRQIETILNYADGTYVPTTPDEDRKRQTAYDDDGRVFKTVDPLGNVTFYGFDTLGRQVRTIQNASNTAYDVSADPDLSAYTPAGGAEIDQDRITETAYDAQGRVGQTTDPAGIVTRTVYDALGRRVKTIANYVVQGTSDPAAWVWSPANNRWERGASDATAIDHGTDNDQNLISETTYNVAGQVVATRDARGTQTAFTYDAAGRRVTVAQAAQSSLETLAYTSYDKAGRVQRTVQNWSNDPSQPAPDEQDGAGNWLFVPAHHGMQNDTDLITEFTYDHVGRRIAVTDPVGNVTQTAYNLAGQVVTVIDAEGVDTVYRYDNVRRRTLVVQNYQGAGYADPDQWWWNTGASPEPQWEDGSSVAIDPDPDQDGNQDINIIVQVVYDRAGRMISLRDPRGNETTYTYDKLGRRLTLTNALDHQWKTEYFDLAGGGTQTKLTDPNGAVSEPDESILRDFDRLGRLSTIQYGDPAVTPDVSFSYDAAGNRAQMTEYSGANFTSPVRETTYGYDDVRRLTSVGYDNDGGGTVDETVSYQYDAGGLRTKLTLPGGTDSISYTYDAKGRLIGLTDWDNQATLFIYDNAGRHIATDRANGLRSRYRYDPASRLRSLRHTKDNLTLGHFEYQVDGRGNRVQAVELLPHPATTNDETISWDDEGVVYQDESMWADDATNGFKVTDSTSARMSLLFYGDVATLTFGTGPEHGIFDVYLGKSLWQSFDGYAASAGSRTVDIPLNASSGKRLAHEGPHLLEIRNRVERSLLSSGHRVRFKQLIVPDVAYDLHTVQYSYDGLSRLLSAATYADGNLNGTPTRAYAYSYDEAGNRRKELLSGTAVTADNRYFGYDDANHLIAEGDTLDVNGEVIPDFTYEYDANGNLLNKQDITPTTLETYTWDRANRPLTAPGSTSYKYDGLGNRVQQTVSSVVTDYLLDTQPGLAVVLQQTTGANVERFVHGPRGIHAQQANSGNWFWPVQDGLGSVRGVTSNALAVQGMQHYAPYGTPFGAQGSLGMPFGFTGEQTDANDLVYLRARYLNPGMGGFASLDPFEGTAQRPMSLNGYSWVEGNVINRVDASGLCWANPSASPEQQSRCADAWHEYTNVITNTYTQNWPRDIQIRVSQEARCWANMPYSEFVSQWNSSRSACTDPGGEVLNSALPIIGGVSILNPGPGPEDILALGGLCIAAIWAIAANAGAISLPLRQPMDFAHTEEDVIDVPITRVYPENYRDDEIVPLFHYGTASKISFILTTQTIPHSDFDANPQRARYGSGVYFTDLVPGTLSKGQISRQIYLAPFYTKDIEAWVMVNLGGLTVVPERDHVFLVPTAAALPVLGKILAAGLTPDVPRNTNP